MLTCGVEQEDRFELAGVRPILGSGLGLALETTQVNETASCCGVKLAHASHCHAWI